MPSSVMHKRVYVAPVVQAPFLDFKTLATPWRFFFPTLSRDLDVSHQNYFINLTLIAYFAEINESNFIISIKN